MASGNRTIVINTQERAVSVDINRLQAFAQADLANVIMRMTLARGSGLLLPGGATLPTIGDVPMSAVIFGGLMVKPQSGSLEIQVDPGTGYFYAPDSDPDASGLKFANDVGVPAATMSMTANASGSVRVDVIECRLNAVPDLVTDSRDVYDATSGLFVAQTVTKETKARLEYRIRLGTPGSGHPGAVAGWTPLCSARVPTATTSNDTIDFYDNRPLYEDRASFRGGGSNDWPTLERADGKIIRVDASNTFLNGRFEATLNGRALGGVFAKSLPGTDTAASINVSDATNGAGVEPATGPRYLYACTPYGLPRWCRYAPFPAARLPRSPVGMLIVSDVAPDFLGRPTAVIPLPAASGLGGNVAVTEAVFVALLKQGAGTTYSSGAGYLNGRNVDFGTATTYVTGALAGSTYTFPLTENEWPQRARAMKLRWGTTITVPANTQILVGSTAYSYGDNAGGNGQSIVEAGVNFYTNSSGSPVDLFFQTPFLRLAAPFEYPGTFTSPRRLRLDFSIVSLYGTAATLDPASASFRVGGFEF